MSALLSGLLEEDDLDPMASQDQQAFATPENVESCCKFLLNSLAGLGMSDRLQLGSSKPEDVAGVCNCLYELIQQRQADRETQGRLESLATKMRLDAQASSSERTRLEGQLQEKFTELGSLEIKLRTMQQKHRGDSDAWAKQAETLNLRCKQAERREQQLETKLRQQQTEADSLRDKLRAAIQSKGRSAAATDAADDSAEDFRLAETAPASLGGSALSAGAAAVSSQRNRFRPSSANNSSGSAGVSGGVAGRNSVRSTSAARGVARDDAQLQKLLEATEARAASLSHDNVHLREQLHDMRTEFEQLLSRCESMGVGVPAEENTSLGRGSSDGIQKAQNKPKQAARVPQNSSARTAHARHTAAAEALSSEELGAYLGSELKAVRTRCSTLLDGLAAKRAARSADGGGQQQQQQGEGGGGDTWDGAVAEAVLQEQLDDAQVLLQEQDKGLARALVALHRAEAQRTAAQQRASAAQLRSVQLEKRLTAATQEQLASGEKLMELRATVYDLEAQVAKLQQVLAIREQEVARLQQSGAAAASGEEGAVLADLQQELAAAQQRASSANIASAQQATLIEAQARELSLVRRQLALMTQAVAMTGGTATADAGEDGRSSHSDHQKEPQQHDEPQEQQHEEPQEQEPQEEEPQQQQQQQHSPVAHKGRGSSVGVVRDLSALLQDEDDRASLYDAGSPPGLSTALDLTPPPHAPPHASTRTRDSGGTSFSRPGAIQLSPQKSASASLAHTRASNPAADGGGVSVGGPMGAVSGVAHSGVSHRGSVHLSPRMSASASAAHLLARARAGQGEDGSIARAGSAGCAVDVRAGGGYGGGGGGEEGEDREGERGRGDGSSGIASVGAAPSVVKPKRLMLQGLVGSGAGVGDSAGLWGGGGSSRRRQRWDVSPSVPAATPSPRQLLQQSNSPSPDGGGEALDSSQLRQRQQSGASPLGREASQPASSPHTPEGLQHSPSTSEASQATLGSFVTAAGGDTPMATPSSAAPPRPPSSSSRRGSSANQLTTAASSGAPSTTTPGGKPGANTGPQARAHSLTSTDSSSLPPAAHTANVAVPAEKNASPAAASAHTSRACSATQLARAGSSSSSSLSSSGGIGSRRASSSLGTRAQQPPQDFKSMDASNPLFDGGAASPKHKPPADTFSFDV